MSTTHSITLLVYIINFHPFCFHFSQFCWNVLWNRLIICNQRHTSLYPLAYVLSNLEQQPLCSLKPNIGINVMFFWWMTAHCIDCIYIYQRPIFRSGQADPSTYRSHTYGDGVQPETFSQLSEFYLITSYYKCLCNPIFLALFKQIEEFTQQLLSGSPHLFASITGKTNTWLWMVIVKQYSFSPVVQIQKNNIETELINSPKMWWDYSSIYYTF